MGSFGITRRSSIARQKWEALQSGGIVMACCDISLDRDRRAYLIWPDDINPNEAEHLIAVLELQFAVIKRKHDEQRLGVSDIRQAEFDRAVKRALKE